MTTRFARGAQVIATLAVAAVAFTGCAGSSDPGPDDAGTELNFVTFTGGDAGIKYENLIAAFEDANPGVKVRLEILAGDDTYNSILTSRIAAGTAPDVFEVLNNDTSQFVEADLLADLSDQSWVEHQIDTVRNLADQSDGRTYSFVPEVNSGGVFYNTDIFEEVGVEVPETWDEFLDVVETIRAAGITPLSVGGKDGWTLQTQWTQMMRASSNPEEGALLNSGELAYSESTTAAIMPAFAELVAAGGFDPNATGVDWPSSANDFALGRTAMMIQGTVALPAIRTAAPDGPFSMFPMPFAAEGKDAPLALAPAATQAVPANAAHQELAKRFLEFWASPEVHTKYLNDAAALSSFTTSASADIDPAFETMSELLPTRGIDIAGFVRPTPAVNTAIQTGMQSIMVGTATADEVLESIDAAQQQQ
ncbi:ABC transporter substrate-binding protein [Microbacterium dauci]|uniref:Extracellular solute-binding protein n=1 Tax=Microbacterium dauci TaxID=3048008 RepID=A0ABT6ZG08_9MICO|nr:extracellular solute-binding protein [Microbacterium sp. LX3-4]MDJ1115091.1 extracellular solute-binding protein [Microbacterium sp. LX3-4]